MPNSSERPQHANAANLSRLSSPINNVTDSVGIIGVKVNESEPSTTTVQPTSSAETAHEVVQKTSGSLEDDEDEDNNSTTIRPQPYQLFKVKDASFSDF
ncbi:hypothetical protein Ddc_03796 [Ditylenchus destructor]|nr:hypothetical protein Ddc_03796 [Ditylenchus destructor]